jgi:Flp pilus assembly protein TadD
MAQRLKKKSRVAASPAGVAPCWDGVLIIKALVIVLAGLAIHWRDLHGGWIGDDSLYFTDNTLLRDPARLWKAWFQPGSFIEYYPIQQSLQWLQWKAWHNDTLGYHLTNVLLHITSALLFWRVLHKLGLKLGWLGGLVFVVHPMTVDSVALANEFKTSLALPPFLLAMLAWIDYEEGKGRRPYLLALAFFVVAMLCKITVMAFPLFIPIYAWWKRGRIGWGDVVAGLPFLAVSIVLGFASIHAGNVYEPERASANADPDLLAGHPLTRFVLVGEIILFYIARAFFPNTPITVYPRWHPDPAALVSYLPWVMLLALAVYFYLKRATWGRHALLGLGFFLVMLAPFNGVHWISYMNITWVLEHILYVPLLGLIGLAVAACEQIYGQLSPRLRPVSVAVAVVAVGLLAWQSACYAAKFADQETLARYVIKIYPKWSVGYVSLGLALLDQHRPYEALTVYQTYLRLDPQNAELENACGEAFQMTGDLPTAIGHFQRSLQIKPGDATCHCNLGTAYDSLNRLSEALEQYRLAVQLDPYVAKIRFDYALGLAKTGDGPGAIAQFQQALALDPNLGSAHDALGVLFQQSGRKAEAQQQFEQALAIDANDQMARSRLDGAP